MPDDDKTVQWKGGGLMSKKIVRGWGTVDNMNINAFARKSGFRDLSSSPDLQIKDKTQEAETPSPPEK